MAEAQKTTKTPWLLFFALSCLIFMVGVDLLGAGLALTPMSHQFNLHLSQLQWFLTAFAMGNSSFLVMSGKLADIYGRRRLFIVGVTLFVLASISIAITPSFYIVCVERFIQGASGGIMATTAVATVSSHFPEKERAHWMAGLVGSAGLGMAIGPIIGGYLIEYYNWQAIFWINVPIGAIALILGLRQLKATSRTNFKKLDYVGIIIFILAVSMLTTTLNNGYIWGWTSTLSIIAGVVTIFLFIAFILYEQYYESPLLHLELFKAQNYIPSNLLGLTLYFGLIAWIFNFSIYYQHVRLFSPVDTGLHFIPLALFLFIGAVLMKKIVGLFRSTKTLLLFAIALNIIGFGLLVFLPLACFTFVSIAFIIIGLGFVIVNANTISIGVKYLPQELVGLGSGTCLMIRWLGSALGAAISGSILYAIPRHYLSKHLNLISSSDLQEVKSIIQGKVISLENIGTSSVKALIENSMTHGIHICMLIVSILYVISLVYSFLAIKEEPA